MKPLSSLLKIGQLAQLCGKTVRALHLYEEMGLLQPAHRTQGGFRLYDASAAQRVQWIGRLQDANLSLQDIKDFLQMVESEPKANQLMDKVRVFLEQKCAAIREQVLRLQQVEADLVAGLAYLESCKVCEPNRMATECENCRWHGHNTSPPLLVSGLHHPAQTDVKMMEKSHASQ